MFQEASVRVSTNQLFKYSGQQCTPLIIASRNGHTAVVKLLIDSGKFNLQDQSWSLAVILSFYKMENDFLPYFYSINGVDS